MPKLHWHDESERSDLAVLPVHLPRMRPPSFWPGSICHLPPTRVGRLIITAFSGNQKPALIPVSVCSRLVFLSIVLIPDWRAKRPYPCLGLFSRKRGLR